MRGSSPPCAGWNFGRINCYADSLDEIEQVVSNRKWNDVTMLPAKEGGSWSLWKGGRQIDTTFSEIAAITSRWLPANPLLVGAPWGTRFVPPVLVPELEGIARRAVRNNCRNMVVAFSVCGLILLLVAASRPESHAFSTGLLLTILGVIIAADYILGLRTDRGLAERALFFRWLKVDPRARHGFFAWLSIALGVGLLQWLLQQWLGGVDVLFHRFGVMYADVGAGEYWRLLSGPYIHYSLFHFLSNAALLLFAGTLAFALFGKSAFLVFLVGNICAALAQMTLGGDAFDNYGGMSGGVYALFGTLIAAGAARRRLFPKGFWSLVLNLTVFGIVTSELLSANAATAAHVSGLLLGGVAGVCYGLGQTS